MRRLGAKTLAWSALAVAAVGAAGGAGCKGKGATEVLPGVSSQMVVPKDLAAVQVEVSANGVRAFCNNYSVTTGGVVQLPSTLGVIPDTTPDTIVTITIRGYDLAGVMGNDYMNCLDSNVDDMMQTGARIMRRSIQKFVDQKVLFLPMPLTYSCQDVTCEAMGDTFACKGGLCLDSNIDSTTLADFDPTLLDGTGICFKPSTCFQDVVPGTIVDPESCIYAFPSWDAPLAGSGVNVKIFYTDYTLQANPAGGMERVLAAAGEEEILNEDPIEGYTVLSAADAGPLPETGPAIPGVDAGPTYNSKGAFIKLAPGLCTLAKAAFNPPTQPGTYHTISDVQMASLCPPKELLLPICAAERNNSAVLPDGGPTTDGLCNVAIPMSPAPSAMYLVMDQSVYMHGAYGANGSAQALALSLSDPVFQQTFAAFKFLNDPAESDCTASATSSSYLTPGLPFDLAAIAQPQIASLVNSWTASEAGTQSAPTNGISCVTGSDQMTNGCPIGKPYCMGTTQCYNPYPLDLQGAMLGVGAYQEVSSFLQTSAITAPNIAGVMFIVNRAPATPGAGVTPPEAADCPSTPASVTPSASAMCGNLDTPNAATATAECTALQDIEAEALSAFTTSGLQTYFVVLGNDDGSPEPLTFYQTAATDVPQAVTTLDATSLSGGMATSAGAMGDVGAFLQSVTELGTCLYELPPEVPSGTAANAVEVTFGPPDAPPNLPRCTSSAASPTGCITKVPPVTNCTAATQHSSTPPDGWSYEAPGRIRICGTTCDNLRQLTIGAATTEAAVPVNITKLCRGGTGGTGADSGIGGQTGADASLSGADGTAGACGPGTCPGCCESTTCEPGDTNPAACGFGGAPCQNCGAGETCAAGVCTVASGDASAD